MDTTAFALPAWWPQDLPPPQMSGVIPVTIPGNLDNKTDTTARSNFDYFSWQSFIALSWPNVAGQRGVADQPSDSTVFLHAGDTPIVWTTYKQDYELFDQGSQRPTAWNSFGIPDDPCAGAPSGQERFVRIAKKGTLLDDTDEAFSYPLIDQDSNYVYFEVSFNEAQYDTLRGPDADSRKWYYLKKNLAAAEPFTMPVSTAQPYRVGAMMLKAAWRILEPEVDSTRFYTTRAQLYDPDTETCRAATLGLVGLHIAQKLQDFPEWIWSTFEQVDNVPDSAIGMHGPYSFNNGTDTPATDGGWANRPKSSKPVPKAARTPVQVTRYNPIPTTPQGASTQNLNRVYQKFLAGTPWQYYELVFTQWPTDPDQFVQPDSGGIYPNDAGGAFPTAGVTNAAMETYFQTATDAAWVGIGQGGNSCMGCHYQGAAKADFSWSLLLRSH